LPSDEPYPIHTPHLRQTAVHYGGLEIYHFGALRDPKAFIRKSKAVQNMFIGSCDERILKYENTDKDWREENYFDLPLQDFVNPMPKCAHAWLKERGYSV
jgi:hypothetical protein